MVRFLLVALLCINWSSVAFCQNFWSYIPNAVLGPANWGGVCSTGRKQSPIDIKKTETVFDKGLGAFKLKNYDRKLNKTFGGFNSGFALELAFPAGVYNVSGGGLPGVYTTVQFHFHYGPNNSVGSEHTVNGEQFAAELHLVSYNTKYANISQAINHADGLAVLGFFITVGGDNNTAFSFLEHARRLNESFSAIDDIPAFRFDTLLPADKTKYFRYNGSLTTPTCNEVVTWTVFNDTVRVSQYQMNLLRNLKKIHTRPSVGNFRPVQPLYNRTVKASFQVSTFTTVNTTATTNSISSTTTTTTTTTTTNSSNNTTTSSSTSTTTTTADATTTSATESAPVPTVEFDLESSAVSLAAGLFLSMLLAALSALFVH